MHSLQSTRSECFLRRQTLSQRAAHSVPTRSRRHRTYVTPCHAGSSSSTGLIIELDSVAVDLHMDGHRVAFNQAYADFGFDCANWTPYLYNDLLARSDGSAESMISTYFDTIGWPLTVVDSERGTFVNKIHTTKMQKFTKMLAAHKVPLRAGVLEIIDAAIESGAKVAAVTGTLSSPEDDVAGNVFHHMGPARASHIKLFSAGLTHGAPVEEADPEDVPADLGASLQQAAASVKRNEAEKFVTALTEASKKGMAGVVLDPSLAAAAAGGQQGLTAPWFLAVTAALDVPISRCVVLVGTGATSRAAVDAGATVVAIPRKLAKSASFPGTKAKFEDMGSGGATWNRLVSLL